MSDFIAQPKYYKKLLFWDQSLEPKVGRGLFPKWSDVDYNREGAIFPSQVRDWTDISGVSVGFCTVTLTTRYSVGLAQDGSELIMSFYRHSNSKPFHLYYMLENKDRVRGRIIGYDISVLAAKDIQFNEEYPPSYTITLSCSARLMSQGRDFYVNGESLGIVKFVQPNDAGTGNIPNLSLIHI